MIPEEYLHETDIYPTKQETIDKYGYYQEKTMHINDMKESKYLKKEDVGDGILVTIKSLDNQNVAPDNQEPENKYLLHFVEDIKPFVLNWTNIQLIAKACESEDTDDWKGKKIVLYNDPSVSFGNKLTGGIRVRAPRQKQPPVTKPDFDDDIPF